MKLHDFLTGAGARQCPTRTVKFKVVGYDAKMVRHVADAKAELSFVTEAQRAEAIRDAEKLIVEHYGDQAPPDRRREDEARYHMLFLALKDHDDPRQPFADSVKELKDAVVLPEMAHVWREYTLFVDEEFPDRVDAEQFEELVEESKKVFFPDLLSRFGSDVVRRSMHGLIDRLTK